MIGKWRLNKRLRWVWYGGWSGGMAAWCFWEPQGVMAVFGDRSLFAFGDRSLFGLLIYMVDLGARWLLVLLISEKPLAYGGGFCYLG